MTQPLAVIGFAQFKQRMIFARITLGSEAAIWPEIVTASCAFGEPLRPLFDELAAGYRLVGVGLDRWNVTAFAHELVARGVRAAWVGLGQISQARGAAVYDLLRQAQLRDAPDLDAWGGGERLAVLSAVGCLVELGVQAILKDAQPPALEATPEQVAAERVVDRLRGMSIDQLMQMKFASRDHALRMVGARAADGEGG